MSTNECSDVCLVSEEEQEKHRRYRDMVHEVRQELKDLHEFWIAKVRGRELRKDNPFKGKQLWNVPAILTAIHNFYLEIRGKEYRHGTAEGFFKDGYNRQCHDKKIQEFHDKYAEILGF